VTVSRATAEVAREAVVLDLGSIDRSDLDLNRLRGAWNNWTLHQETGEGAVRERVREAGVVVSNKVVLDRETLGSATGLRLVCVAATGTNNVDLEAARDLEIAVTNVTGYGTPSVVQHVFALILALTTRLPEYMAAVAAGAWERGPQFCLLDFPIRELSGLTLGIVGYGELGRGVARLAEAFGMRVLLAQRPGGPEQPGRLPLSQLLPEVDILTLHCPLTPHTRNLIGAAALGLMKPDAVLINTARGGIVDESALLEALLSRRIGGAGVDVLTTEPPRRGNPLLTPDVPNLILTPHVAWASRQSRQRLIDEVAENIVAFRRGEARNRIV